MEDDSYEGSRQQRAKKDNSKRLSALEQLKKARQGEKVKYEVKEEDELFKYEEVDEDDYIDDYDDYTSSSSSKNKKKPTKSSKKFDDSDDEQEEAATNKQKSNKNLTKQKITDDPPANEDTSAAKTSSKDIRLAFANAKIKKIEPKYHENNSIEDDLVNEIMQELNAKTTPIKTTKRFSSTTSNPKPSPVKRKLSPPAPQTRPEKRLELDSNLLAFCSTSEFLDDHVEIKQEAETPMKVKQEPITNDSTDLEDIELLASLSIKNESTTPLSPPMTMPFSTITQVDENDLKSIKSKLEISSDIQIYWFDAHEDTFGSSGCVYLFGKMQVPDKPDCYLSVCCQVRNIPRRIYVLPRKYKYDRRTRQTFTDQPVTVDMVNEEIDRLMEKYKIYNFRAKTTDKYFAFDCDSADVPYKCEYLQIEYPPEYPALPSDIEGETFAAIFGTNTQFLETLILDLKLKGPNWLQINDAKRRDENMLSWCRLEFVIDDYKKIQLMKQPPQVPPLTSLTFVIKTALNKKTQEHEIICACGIVNQRFYLDKTTTTTTSSTQLYDSYFCALSKPSNAIFPFDFNNVAQNLQKKFKIEVCSSERALLSYVLCKLNSIDADILIGHDLFGFNFDILLNRCLTKKVGNWSRLGRLKRNYMPKHISTQRIQIVCSGRLLCDVMLSAKELLTKLKSFDLNELVKIVLKEQMTLENDEKTIYNYYNSSQLLLKLIRLCMQDATFIYRICNDLNSIQLAYQLTCIAGNCLSRTLIGGRSERNEYLLLHAFYDKDFILPDKQTYAAKFIQKNAAAGGGGHKGGAPLKENSIMQTTHTQHDMDIDDEENEGKVSKAGGQTGAKNKASYAGGLVLEPKVGFYDHFILLLDFNSLYPSIIQEYNICFTTISRPKYNEMETDLDEYLESCLKLPANDDKLGILPAEIRKLVDSRRQVKKLLQNDNLSSDLKMQYDIRQKALKLTANSMYGCLGFENSRFYCKPLAALITRFGRTILQKTKDLVESKKIEVIYGDTDSIMINTNLNDYEAVLKIGNQIKSDVNKLYKCLEIGIDGVFKCLLLLKKKKYAALVIDGRNNGNGQLQTHQELKGLDIVRRDWCGLAKEIGEKCLTQILSGLNCDLVIQNINQILFDTAEKLSKNAFDLSLFEIHKQLNRNPEEYNDSNHQSHVLVALRMNSDAANNKKFRSGDVVSYIICEDGTTNSATQRAYARSELEKEDSSLKVDQKYYLSQQIHPIVSRLCEPIEGIDGAHIATCLGLDPSGFRNKSSSSAATSTGIINPTLNKQQQKMQIYLNEREKYKNCQPFKYTCPGCKSETVWKDAFIRNEESGEMKCILDGCSNESCKLKPSTCLAYIKNSLTKQINVFIKQYYQFWLVCEDSMCACKTKRLSCKYTNYKSNCIECDRYQTSLDYAHSDLYNQMRYYKYIFDIDSYKTINKQEQLSLNNELLNSFKELRDFVGQRIKKNAYGTVNLKSIFFT